MTKLNYTETRDKARQLRCADDSFNLARIKINIYHNIMHPLGVADIFDKTLISSLGKNRILTTLWRSAIWPARRPLLYLLIPYIGNPVNHLGVSHSKKFFNSLLSDLLFMTLKVSVACMSEIQFPNSGMSVRLEKSSEVYLKPLWESLPLRIT